MSNWRISLVVVFALSACTTLPDTGAITNFGNSTAKTATVFKQGVEQNALLAVQISAEKQATNLLAHRKYTLNPNGDDLVPEASVLGPKLAALSALEQYGKALAAASNPQTVANLQAAAAQLTASTGRLAAVLAPGTSSLTGPAGAVISQVGGVIIMNNYAVKIRKIIAAQDPTVRKLAELLKHDAAIISDELLDKGGLYEERRHLTLDYVADDKRMDSLRLYEAYQVAQRDVAAANQMAGILENYSRVLDAMVKAHHALATNQPDAASQVARFLALVESLSGLLKALNA